jgi:predicted unusual protein kinase regulating ubiquinone biosynthesis (AarF/ABC1/UbiB family)
MLCFPMVIRTGSKAAPSLVGRAQIDSARDALAEKVGVPARTARVLEPAVRQVAGKVLEQGAEPGLQALYLKLFGPNPGPVAQRLFENATAGAGDALLSQLWPEAGKSAERELVEAALHSFVDPSISAEERRALLSKASQDPLTHLVFESMNNVLALLPSEAVSGSSDWLQAAASRAPESLKQSLVSTERVAELSRAVSQFKSKLDSPRFRTQIGYVLLGARTLGRLEADNLSRVAYDVSPEKRPGFEAALRSYAAEVAKVVLPSLVALTGESGAQALAMLELATLAGEGLSGGASAPLVDVLRVINSAVGEASGIGQAVLSEAEVFTALDGAHAKLSTHLEEAGVLTAESEVAVNELAADLSALVATVMPLWSLGKVFANQSLSEDELIEQVRVGAKRSGPIAIKMAQTVGNILSESEGADGAATKALRALQDNVPAMSEAELRTQVSQALGKPIEEAFVEFDMKPVAAASIAQVHRAVIQSLVLGRRTVAVKVQRPGLDDEFARASRVSRLVLGFIREGISSVAEVAEQSESREAQKLATRLRSPQAKGVAKLIEGAIVSFVDDFAHETDFKAEAKALSRFRRMMGVHPYIMAPRPYRRWSSNTVLTTDFVQFEKFTSLLKRAKVSREAAKAPALSLQGLDAKSPAAKAAVADHVRRVYGLDAVQEGITLTPAPKNQLAVTVPTTDSKYPLVELTVGSDGYAEAIQAPVPPDAERMERLTARYLASVAVQVLIGGLVHGDPHDGNLGIAVDGETIAWLDFGKMIEFGLDKKVSPFGIGVGALLSKPEMVAAAAVGLTDLDPGSAEAKELKAALMERLISLEPGPIRERSVKMAQTVMEVLTERGAKVSSVFTQGLKASGSFVGNYNALSEASESRFGLLAARDIGEGIFANMADALTLRLVGGERTVAKDATLRRRQRSQGKVVNPPKTDG